MGIFSSKVDIIIDPSMNEITVEKIELKRAGKSFELPNKKNKHIFYSGKLNQRDQFTYVIINDKLQCIIPENIIKYSDVTTMSIALESVKRNEYRDREEELMYQEYDKLKVAQKLSDRMHMLSDKNNKINLLHHFTI